jgi:hypothetical protein
MLVVWTAEGPAARLVAELPVANLIAVRVAETSVFVQHRDAMRGRRANGRDSSWAARAMRWALDLFADAGPFQDWWHSKDQPLIRQRAAVGAALKRRSWSR